MERFYLDLTIQLLIEFFLVTTRSEGRRAVEQGGVTINGEKINDIKTEYEIEELTKNGEVLFGSNHTAPD